MAAENFIDNEFEGEWGSDDEIKDEEHGKLLRSVHMMDSMQRIKPPTRTEPSLNISEFDLAPIKGGGVHLRDLARSLESHGKAFDADVAQKLRNLTRTSSALAKPLEKPVAQKIKRVVAYNNLKKQVERWDAIVQTNRHARTMMFPMDIEPVKIQDSTDLATGWKSQTPTPLEAGLNALHRRSKVFQEDQKEQEEFRLTLAELREKRKEMAKLRAQQSYQEAKARRNKKIKSKKFHRILRREKMQKQLQDFESLQKTDPEAALKQLEQLEKVRAEERMTLRHKSTGQWARSRLIRAKYDPQTRQQLAEQLAVSRELTKKTKGADSSDEEDQDLAETQKNEASRKFADDKDNPWITVKPASEVEEFVSGYKKYWEEQNQQTELGSKGTEGGKNLINKGQSTLAATSEVINVSTNSEKQYQYIENMDTMEDESVNCQKFKSPIFNSTMHTEKEIAKDKACFNKHDNMKQHMERNNFIIDKKNENIESKNCDEIGMPVDNCRKMIESNDKVEIVTVSKLKIEGNKKLRSKKNVLKTPKSKVRSTSKCWVVTPISEDIHDVNAVTEKQEDVRTVVSDNLVDVFLASVLPDALESEGKKKRKKKSALDKMFDQAEENLSVQVQDKLHELKHNFALKNNTDLDSEEVRNGNEESDLGSSLALKNMREMRSREDTELMELSPKDISSGKAIAELAIKASNINGVGGLTGQMENSKPPEMNINPDNFIAAKPKVLLTAAPELITAGEEALDDEMENDQQTMIISEAFADDDVVDDFRKEKEEEIEKSKPKDIDLSLPGWGEWGGVGIEVSKRKKRRFIVKAPPQPNRHDANKSNVIIKETKATGIREHQVCELPNSFHSVKDFEASVRAPIGSTWVPQTAHKKLIESAVITKMGTVIKPMNEEFLVKKKTLVEIND